VIAKYSTPQIGLPKRKNIRMSLSSSVEEKMLRRRKRIMIPSPKVATYDLVEMSAGITDAIIPRSRIKQPILFA
jgi:hypothetical protein